MESPKTQNLFKTYLDLGYKLGYSPYKYDSSSSSVIFLQNRWKKMHILINLFFLLLYEIFAIYRYLKTASSDDSKLADNLAGAFFPLLYLFLNLNHIFTYQLYGEYHRFVNQLQATLLDTRNNLQRYSKGKLTVDESRLQKLIYLLTVIIFSSATARSAKVLFKPESPELLSSLLESPRSLHIIFRIPISYFHFTVIGIQAYTCSLHGITFGLYLYSVIPLLLSLRLEPDSTYKISSLRNICLLYRRLNILERVMHSCYKLFPLIIQMILMIVGIVRLFFAIVFDSVVSFLGGVSILLTIQIAFRTFSDLHDAWEETFSSWRHVRFPWFWKFKRSCGPISVWIGDYFPVDTKVILIIFKITFDITITLVLAYKGNIRGDRIQ